MYVTGFGLVVVAMWIIFVQSGVSAFIPLGMFVGFVILMGGLALMGGAAIFAERVSDEGARSVHGGRRGRRLG